MAGASYLQTSFLGGEWSQYVQGRADKESYRSALNVCRNALPIEEGAWTRRSGAWFNATTRKGVAGKTLALDFSQGQPYNIELTNGHMRFFAGNTLVLESHFEIVQGVSAASPAEFTTAAPHGWATGDEVGFFLSAPVVGDGDGLYWVWRRQYEITVTSATTFTAVDPVTGAPLDGSTIVLGGNIVSVARVLDYVTPWTGTLWEDVWLTQSEEQALLLHPTIPAQVLKITSKPNLVTGAPAGFIFTPAVFSDGPYLDPPTDGSTVTPSGLSGVITLSLGYNAWSGATTYGAGDVVVDAGSVYVSIADNNLNHTPASSGAFWQLSTAEQVGLNGGQGFLATDVGRQIRLFSEPLAWNSATAYAKGATVKYGDSYWSAIQAATNQQPDTQIAYWAISTTAAVWTWGTIIVVTDGSHVNVQLKGGALLYTDPIQTWRIGIYGETLGYPTKGTFHQGRFWLTTDAIGNHFDTTETNNGLVMSPTEPDGTVADNNGMSFDLEADGINSIYWLISHDGVIMGTQAGEWVVQASAMNDPITPSSIQAHRRTKFGCKNVLPVQTPMAICFVNRSGRKVIEYVSDVYSGKFTGTNLSLTNKKLAFKGIKQIAYVTELAPVIWAIDVEGNLFGCTYKRESPFGTQPANFSGWHRHDLGSGRKVTSIQAGPSVNGTLDAITLVTVDDDGVYFVETLANLFDEDDILLNANFLDESDVPGYAQIVGDNVRLYGYYYLAGQSGISVFAAGLDLGGNFTVSARGTVDVPFDTNNGNPLFTRAYLALLTSETDEFPDFNVKVGAGVQAAGQPVLTGIYNYDLATDSGGVLPRFDTGDFIVKSPGTHGTTSGYRKFNFPDHTAKQFTDLLTIFPAAVFQAGDNYYFTAEIDALGADGKLYWTYTDGNKSGPVMRAPYESLVSDAHFGNPSGAGGGIDGSIRLDGSHFPSVASATTVETASGSWYASIAAVGDPGTGDPTSIQMIYGPTMAWVYYTDILEQAGSIVRGPSVTAHGSSQGLAYILGKDANNGETTTPSTLYRLAVNDTADKAPVSPGLNAGISLTVVKTLHPADIVAGWTHFSSVNGLMYDETDGNLIGCFGTDVPATYNGGTTYGGNGLDKLGSSIVRASNGHDYVAHFNGNFSGQTPIANPTYWTDLGLATYSAAVLLVKLRSSDGSVVWALNWPYSIPGDRSLGLSRCRFGKWGFVEGAIAPARFVYVDTIAGTATLTSIPGLTAGGAQHYDDTTAVCIFYAGSFDGSVPGAPVPQGSTDNLFSNHWAAFIGIPTTITNYQIPAVVGYSYTSQGQLLRPILPGETGAQNGPALGKTRRTHMVAALLANTQGISFGSDFTKMHPAVFKTPGGNVYSPLQLWTGTFWDTLEDGYSFDSMPAWQITRPYPATALAVEAFLKTQDR